MRRIFEMNEMSELEQVTTDWIKFRGKNPALKRKSLRVTLNKGKELYLSEKAMEALGSPRAVQMYFDVKTSRIGLKADAIDALHAYPVNRRGAKGQGYLGVMLFCRHFNIRLERSVEFEDVTVDKDGMMILDLGKVTRVR